MNFLLPFSQGDCVQEKGTTCQAPEGSSSGKGSKSGKWFADNIEQLLHIRGLLIQLVQNFSLRWLCWFMLQKTSLFLLCD